MVFHFIVVDKVVMMVEMVATGDGIHNGKTLGDSGDGGIGEGSVCNGAGYGDGLDMVFKVIVVMVVGCL